MSHRSHFLSLVLCGLLIPLIAACGNSSSNQQSNVSVSANIGSMVPNCAVAVVRNERDEHFLQIAGSFLEKDGANFLSDVGVFLAEDGAKLVAGSGELVEDSADVFRVVGRFLGDHVNSDVGQFIEEDFADVTEDVGQLINREGSDITHDVGVFMRDDGARYTRIAGDTIQRESSSILLALDLFPAAYALRPGKSLSVRRLPILAGTACSVADNIDINETVQVVGSVLGDVINDNPLWYRVTTESGKDGFIHSSELDVDPMTLATSIDRLPTIHELDYTAAIGFGKAMEDTYMTNVRQCASTSACPVIGQLFPGEPFVIFEIIEGSNFQGSRAWYMVTFREVVGFVHVKRTEPVDL